MKFEKEIRELVGRIPLEKIEEIVAERILEVLEKGKKERKSPEETFKILKETFGLDLKKEPVADMVDFFPH